MNLSQHTIMRCVSSYSNELVKVVADESEVKKYSIGERVIVASKAFNPIIKKLH